MAIEKLENTLGENFQFSNLPQLEWSKRAVAFSATACAGVLGFAARRLQAQAEFLQSLAGCSDMSEVMHRQSEFWTAAWGACAT